MMAVFYRIISWIMTFVFTLFGYGSLIGGTPITDVKVYNQSMGGFLGDKDENYRIFYTYDEWEDFVDGLTNPYMQEIANEYGEDVFNEHSLVLADIMLTSSDWKVKVCSAAQNVGTVEIDYLRVREDVFGFQAICYNTIFVVADKYTSKVEFNEIDFGKPSEKRGATVAKGFMFKWTDKMKRQGRLNANLQIFLSKAVGSLVNFYDKQYLDQYIAGAEATAPTGLSNWGNASKIDPIKDEILICDAMSEGGDSGFEATTVFVSRADYLARQVYLKSFNGKIENELEYVPMGSALATGDAVVVDESIPVATIEKYASEDYSTVRKSELAAEKAGTIDELQVPESFINIWEPEMKKPGVHEVFLWAESNVNVVEGKGIMTIKLDGS